MKTIADFPKTTRWVAARWIETFCRSQLLAKLANIREGYLEIVEPGGGVVRFGDANAAPELRARITIHHAQVYSRIALGGSIGVGEAFTDGDWDTANLVAVTRLFVRNREVLNGLDRGSGALLLPLQRFLHGLRANDESQARMNIQAHYDLGNDFFSLFLDESWMYSAGIFRDETTTLAQAQFEKNDRICRRLELRPEHHLIEIGTGWGGFAIHAARHYGCRVTTTTISKRQFELAQTRVREAGLEDRIEILFQDYRTLQGQYDRLVSIEMIEAVGLKFLDTYFEICSSLLKPDGAMALQSITIRDEYFAQAAKSVDFIQTHIFPGAAIPSVGRILASVAGRTDLKTAHFEDFGRDYARTLSLWAKSLEENRERIPRMGYPEHLYRLWKYYFGYCEGGFLEGQIGVGQFVFTKPRAIALDPRHGVSS